MPIMSDGMSTYYTIVSVYFLKLDGLSILPLCNAKGESKGLLVAEFRILSSLMLSVFFWIKHPTCPDQT